LRSAIADSQSAGGFGQPRRCLRERGDARADVADHRRVDAHVAVGFLRRDVDLDELLAAPAFDVLPPHVLPLPCDSSQLRRAPISMTTSASGST
jgi:hypothetical protein